MKPIGTIHSHDQTRTAVIYAERNGSFTVATRKPDGREGEFETCHTVFDAVHTAESRVRGDAEYDRYAAEPRAHVEAFHYHQEARS
jgi:hypothetical protein